MTELPALELAFPGPLRDELVAAVLDGSKTSTAALLRGYEVDGEDLPTVGSRWAVLDSLGAAVCTVEVTRVRVVALRDVDERHAIAEGEGYRTVAGWRAAHLQFWDTPGVRAELGDIVIDDDTTVVLEEFRLAAPGGS